MTHRVVELSTPVVSNSAAVKICRRYSENISHVVWAQKNMWKVLSKMGCEIAYIDFVDGAKWIKTI